jgi:LCP family protein required for cell wall assembly
MNPRFNSSRKRRPVGFLVLIVVGVALLVLPAVGFVALRVAGDLTQRLNAMANGDAGATPLPPLSLPEIGLWQGTERITVLLLGIDQRPGEDPNTARTDTMMLLTLDPQSRSAGMMSIPRDLYLPLPDRGMDRINTAHVYGGPQYAMRAVEYNFGVPIQYYARVDFTTLTSLIDLVGGIDVFNETDINDPTYPDNNYGYDPFVLSAGWHTLDGQTALKFARTRHGDSDFSRITRQQQVIMALRDKLRTTDAATKILPRIPQIMQTLGGAIDTNLSTVQIAQLALLAKDIPDERISRVAIDDTATQPHTTPTGGSVVIPIRERVRELREQFFNPPANTPASTALPPATGRIAIQNGTPRVGLAASTQAFLAAQGHTIDSIADAPQRYERTAIVIYGGKQKLGQDLAQQLGVPLTSIVLAAEPSGALDALIILGDDYQPQ